MKQWCIIQFSNGDTELVPHTWVSEDRVFWPPYPSKDTAKVRTAIRRRDEPCDGWQTFQPIKVLVSRDTYEEAQRSLERYLKQHCDTTDMESDDDKPNQGRFKRANQIYVQEDDDHPQSKRTYPPLPKVSLPAASTQQPSKTSGKVYHNLQPLYSSFPSSMNYQVLQSSAMLPLTEDVPATTHLTDMPAVQPGPTFFQGFSHEDTRDSARQALKDVVLQKLLAMVTELSSDIKDLRKEVQEMHASRCCQPVRVVGQQVAMLDLPIRNLDDFDHAESTLQSPEACKALVTRLTFVGGNSLESRIRRILSLMLTNEVASVLNWAGKKMKDEKKQKRAFKETMICKCIHDALTQQPGTEMDDFAFGQAVQKWLRYAPDRVGGVGRSGNDQISA